MKPLDGVRVLDLTRLLPGPYATMLLASLGASVDKVEDPAGDPIRLMPPFEGDESVLFRMLNGGKRSVCLDLKDPAGKKALLAMVEQNDVLIEQFRPGTMERLGLSWDVLRERNPRLIFCRLTGYGQTGPLALRAGHDLNYLARSGLLGMQGPGDGLPTPPGFQLADIGGALFSVISILSALRECEKTGHGQVLDVSMTDATLGFGIISFANLLAGEMHLRGGEPLTGGLAVYRTYATKDGRAVALASLEPKFWKAFLEGNGIAFDPMATLPGPHQADWHARLEALFLTRTRDEWAAFGAAHDCCLEPVLTPMEALEDEQTRARGHLTKGGKHAWGLPFESCTAGGRAPRIGEHTQAALCEAGLLDGANASTTLAILENCASRG